MFSIYRGKIHISRENQSPAARNLANYPNLPIIFSGIYPPTRVHPGGDALMHALPEGETEGFVVAITALGGQLLGSDRTPGSGGLVVDTYTMTVKPSPLNSRGCAVPPECDAIRFK